MTVDRDTDASGESQLQIAGWHGGDLNSGLLGNLRNSKELSRRCLRIVSPDESNWLRVSPRGVSLSAFFLDYPG